MRSKQLVDGKLLKVFRDDVLLSDGKESVREWIQHPGASAVVPIFEDGTTVLVRQYRYPSRRVFLEVPAGKLDVEGENPEDVALRELEEETGWRAESLTHLGSFYPCIGYSNELIHFYVAEGLYEGTRNLSEGELVETVSLPFVDAVQMARQGDLHDMKTVVALMLAEQYSRRS